MKLVILIIVILHGLIHLLGFAKGCGFKEIKELTLPISKPMGLMWLAATLLILTFGILYFLNSPYAWLAGLVAVVTSQVLVVLYWKDAKFGTLPNILILVMSIASLVYSSSS